MKKLSELLVLKPQAGTFGVEIECEGENLSPVDNSTWRTEDDGSLRGAFPRSRCEWVLVKPLPLGKALTAVSSLARKQEKDGATPDFSFRTSVHIHVNVQEMTQDQYFNFIYAYLLLEEPMLRFCGAARKANRFCLSMNDGEGLLDYLSYIFQNGVGSLGHINENDVRYAAMNIAATRKYGSLEFRGMRGTLDVDVLSTWILALNSIREYAMEHKNVHAIHDEFVKHSPTQFMRNVLKDMSPDFEYDGMEGDLRNNFSVTLELIYAYKPVKEAAVGFVEVEKEVFAVAPRAPLFREMNIAAILDEIAAEQAAIHAGRGRV
jgi:hypothetical protein